MIFARCFLVALFVFISFFEKAHALNLADIIKAGKIRVAVDSTYPPMEFESSDGKVVGLDIDLANALAKELKVKAEFIVMPWDGILAGLQSNRYDIIMSSMNITPERSAQVDFVPYLQMGQVFVSKAKTPPVKSDSDLKGRVIAVQVDTTSFSAVEAIMKKGIKPKDLKTFPGATETFSAVKSNQADVIVTDEAVGKYYASLDQKSFVVTGVALKPEPIGIAVRKSDKELSKALTEALKAIKKNGEYSRIYQKWLNEKPVL